MRRLSLSLLILSWSFSAHAGAWLLPKGDGIAITQISTFSSDRYWDAQGNRQPQARYGKWEIQPYIEYGLTTRHTIGATAYLQRAEQAGETNTGIADPEFFVRTLLWQGESQVVSLQPLVKLPSLFAHRASPRGGSSSADAELSLLYGQNLHLFSDRDYLDLRAGYRYRTNLLYGQYKADAALGLSPWVGWQIIPALRLIKAEKIDTTTFVQDGDLDYDLLKAELTVAYALPGGNWLQASYFDHIDGKQTGDGRGVSLGYAVRF